MALLGDQRKIDANKDGEITAKDFEMLREQRRSGGLLDDDTMRMGYADGNMVGPEEREVDFGMRDDYVNREILTGIVNESKMIGKYKDKEKYSNPEKLEAHLNKYMDKVEKNTKNQGTLDRAAMRDEFMKELNLYGVGREKMAEGGEAGVMTAEEAFNNLPEALKGDFKIDNEDSKFLINKRGDLVNLKSFLNNLDDEYQKLKEEKINNKNLNMVNALADLMPDIYGVNKSVQRKKLSEADVAKLEELENYFNQREQKAEGGEMEMLPDEEMEQNFIDFVVDEALSDEEKSMLEEQLEANPELSVLFDKVIERASEFTGAGPVDGPGTGTSDDIPARLSDGEFVFTAKAVEQIGADNLMKMMKDAEAAYDAGSERKGYANGEEVIQDEDINRGIKKVEVEYSVQQQPTSTESLLGQPLYEEDETSKQNKELMRVNPTRHVYS